jgi:DNA-binding transcriptional MerR regulator
LNKAPDAFRTISEVADELDVPQHVLRFWESRFQQIRPMKRGGGRRYYRPEDVDLLRGIRHLLYGEGYTIRGVQRILRDQGQKFVQSVWQAGAEQPQRAPDDDADAGDELAAEVSAAPDAFASPSEAEGAVAANSLGPPPPRTGISVAAGLSREDARRLAAVLDDLVECRRLLDGALAERG